MKQPRIAQSQRSLRRVLTVKPVVLRRGTTIRGCQPHRSAALLSQSCRPEAIQQSQLASVACAQPLETRGEFGGAAVALCKCVEVVQQCGGLVVLGRAL